MSRLSSGPGEWNRYFAFRALLRRSSQNPAYPRTSPRIANRGRSYRLRETPASGHVRGTLVSEMGLIAMQKVEGSNPFSRFFAIPLHVGGSYSARAAPETRSNHPCISSPFQALVVVTHDVVPAQRVELRAACGRESRVLG